MAEALLTSEAFIKSATSISDNIANKYLRPSIREAQDVQFRTIVGDTLLNKLKEIVAAGTAEQPENAHYKALLDRAQYYIAYVAIVELTYKVAFKVANAGVVKTPDERMETGSTDDVSQVRGYYQAKADSACLDLQNFILNNWRNYPELNEGDYHRIHACLYSAASCGVFLGGPRGKGPGVRVYRRCRR